MARRKKTPLVFASDFETTVFDGQTFTEVWASALVAVRGGLNEPVASEEVEIFTSIEDWYKHLNGLRHDCKVYFHNLKFDGSFILSYLLSTLGYIQAYTDGKDDMESFKTMPKKSFTHCISEMGQWYKIVIKTPRGNYIEIIDSLKLLPFSLKKIGESFKTKHQKLEMEYIGKRQAGGIITDSERKYIENDVLVLKEALEIIFQEGHNRLTIGSCCLQEFINICGGIDAFNRLFKDLDDPDILPDYILRKNYWCNSNRQETGDGYFRQSYRGGWTFCVNRKMRRKFKNGITLDVNSLYPSMMSSESGNYFPVGVPIFFDGEPPKWLKYPNKYWFIRFRCRFKIKKNKLPFVQIKNLPNIYKPNDYLETTNYIDSQGKECRFYQDMDGQMRDTCQCFMMSMHEFELFKEHYLIMDLEYLDGAYFDCEKGLFDGYIEKYKEIKMNSVGAQRELAKLFLNNLYGKFASSSDSSFKTVYLDPNGVLKFETHHAQNKQSGYIPIGSAITSYARCFTIRAAQMNYYGPNARGFIYADTDSIHCDLKPEEVKGCPIHESKFCHWKIESIWSVGWFVRQKTYIEVENGKYTIKACGMSSQCKKVFLIGMKAKEERSKYYEGLSKYCIEFLENLDDVYTIESFDYGLELAGRLTPKQIKGGVLLMESTFKLWP